jgi:hypothetical protein
MDVGGYRMAAGVGRQRGSAAGAMGVAHLDQLKADVTITADEHAQQRARILGEL